VQGGRNRGLEGRLEVVIPRTNPPTRGQCADLLDQGGFGFRYSAFFRVSGFGLRISIGRSALAPRPIAALFLALARLTSSPARPTLRPSL
jgi:hypothetical protein